jgi:hypothetical protein
VSNLDIYFLTNSVAQEPEGSSPHSQQPATGPCPETDIYFLDTLYDDCQLLADSGMKMF